MSFTLLFLLDTARSLKAGVCGFESRYILVFFVCKTTCYGFSALCSFFGNILNFMLFFPSNKVSFWSFKLRKSVFRATKINTSSMSSNIFFLNQWVIVTATAHVKIFEAKIRSNLTWHSNMLQTKDLSEKHIRNQKSPPARDDEKRRRRNQSLEHGDVPIFGIYTT